MGRPVVIFVQKLSCSAYKQLIDQIE